MIMKEQSKKSNQRDMSMILWDMFTGSAPYRQVFIRCLHPRFIGLLIWNTLEGFIHKIEKQYFHKDSQENAVERTALGKSYSDGEIIVRQGEKGNSMYVIQSGRAEVLIGDKDNREIQLAVLSKGDFFGEMALIQEEERSATVRAVGEVRVIVVDKRIFLRRVHEDPSFAFRIMEKMAKRIRELDNRILYAGQGKQIWPTTDLHKSYSKTC
jgi:signal-transduction protein with cAMP-binding, CBS, and nucleotidyltransferase domain